MMNTLLLYVENQPGVINRVSSVFRRRDLNIESLNLGRTQRLGIGWMTITFFAERDQAARIESNLRKLISVLEVEDITNQSPFS